MLLGEIQVVWTPKRGTVLSAATWRSREAVGTPVGRKYRRRLEKSPDTAALGRGDHPPVSAKAARRVRDALRSPTTA